MRSRFDPLAEVQAAAGRWVAAVNADARHGAWRYAMVQYCANAH
jgi:hypothetical protein